MTKESKVTSSSAAECPIPKGGPILPLAEFTPPENLLYWYRPQFRSDPSGLRWLMSLRTYDISTKTEGSQNYGIDFTEYGIDHPVLARAIIALPQLHAVSLNEFKRKLDVYGALPEKPETPGKPFTTFITASAPDFYGKREEGMPFPRQYFLGDIGGTLMGGLVKSVSHYTPNIFGLFDTAVSHPAPDQGLEVIDTFVSFYNGARKAVLTRAQNLTQAILTNAGENPTTTRIILESGNLLASTLHSYSEKSRFDPAFKTIIKVAEPYLTAFQPLEDPAFPLHKGLTVIEKEGKPQVKIKEEAQQKMWQTYQQELHQGIELLLASQRINNGLIPTSQRAIDWVLAMPLIEGHKFLTVVDLEGETIERHTNETSLSVIEAHGPVALQRLTRCPFFQAGWNHPDNI